MQPRDGMEERRRRKESSLNKWESSLIGQNIQKEYGTGPREDALLNLQTCFPESKRKRNDSSLEDPPNLLLLWLLASVVYIQPNISCSVMSCSFHAETGEKVDPSTCPAQSLQPAALSGKASTALQFWSLC